MSLMSVHLSVSGNFHTVRNEHYTTQCNLYSILACACWMYCFIRVP